MKKNYFSIINFIFLKKWIRESCNISIVWNVSCAPNYNPFSFEFSSLIPRNPMRGATLDDHVEVLMPKLVYEYKNCGVPRKKTIV